MKTNYMKPTARILGLQAEEMLALSGGPGANDQQDPTYPSGGSSDSREAPYPVSPSVWD